MQRARTRRSVVVDSEDDVSSAENEEVPQAVTGAEETEEATEAAEEEQPEVQQSTEVEASQDTTEEAPATPDKEEQAAAEQEEDRDAYLSCETDAGIIECLQQWETSDGFLNSSDPYDLKASMVIDFCAWQCGSEGTKKAEFSKAYKARIIELWIAQHKNGTSIAAPAESDVLMEGADYIGEDEERRDYSKKYMEDSDSWTMVDEGADPKAVISDRGLLVYDPHDQAVRIHTLAKHKEGGKIVGGLSHGQRAVLRKHPQSTFILLFFPGDLTEEMEKLEDEQEGELMVAQIHQGPVHKAAKNEGIDIEDDLEDWVMQHTDKGTFHSNLCVVLSTHLTSKTISNTELNSILYHDWSIKYPDFISKCDD